VESITGSGLAFSVDSFGGATGAFGGGYVAGTVTTGPVFWTSTAQSASGSVTFNKTVYATAATVVAGVLSDTATLTGSDGFSTVAGATIDVSTDATTSLSVSKTTTLQIASPETFTFHLFDGATNTATGDTATVTIPASGNGPVSSNTITGLSPTGTYYFKEDATAPYPPQTTSPVTFSLVAGDLSSCSASIAVLNAADPATAQVRKNTLPASSGLWTFTLTGPNGLSETLTNVQAGGGYFAFTSPLDVDGGTYTITETPQAGYDLTNVTGDVAGNAGRVSTDNTALTCSFTLNLSTDSGQVFECTFTNTQRGHIIVKKVTLPSGSTQLFTFNPSYGSSFQLADGQANDSGLLVPGNYSVSEAATAGWDQTGATCDDGDNPSNITLAAGATVTCTFTNTQRGTIVVKKVTVPAGSSQLFTFNPSYESSFQLADGQSNSSPLLASGGGYSVSEASIAGWDLTGASCDNGNNPSNITLLPGATVTCTFTNTQRGHAKVVKTVNGLPPSGSQSFTFQLRQGASISSAGTILESGVANATDGGVINFATYLVPGTTYQLCEQLMPGWMTSLGPPFFAVYNPSGDNSVVCTDFTVTAGQTKVFDVNNTPPPGGRALTIGFWKNWASCSSSHGKQKPVLDQTLLAAANAGHPITIGTLVLDPRTLGATTACQDAVSLLNKTPIGGKKAASDPLFNMAAQLLAADLNVAAGAGTCASAINAINLAQALLLKYSFNGSGYTGKLTAADANLAYQLAGILDQYNNNQLC
jgi:plastocyanin